MHRTIIVAALVTALVVGGLCFFKDEARLIFFGEPIHWVRIGGGQIFVSIADTQETRKQGLSGTSDLGELEGKLFVFDEPGLHGIWMREMNYAIDIIWINDALKVVHVEHKVDPDTYPKTFTPPQPARYVLEVSAGVSEANGIRTGDSVGLSEDLAKRHQQLLAE